MRAKELTRSALIVLIGCVVASSGHAERFDYLIGANSPGGVHLAKRFWIPAGSTVSGVEFVTNEISTSFPELTIVDGHSRRLSTARVLASVENVRSSGRHRIRVDCSPIAFSEETSVLVAIAFPPSNGVRGASDGIAIAARELTGSPNSYFLPGREAAFGEMDVEFAIELMFEHRGKAGNAVPGESQVEREMIPAETYLNAGGSAGNTVLRFGLPRDGDVSLTIFDVKGRRVRTVVQGHLSAGVYTRAWTGRNNAGVRVASGVYLVRLIAGDQILSQKVVRAR